MQRYEVRVLKQPKKSAHGHQTHLPACTPHGHLEEIQCQV
jgi:hypothetical protein